MASDFKKKAKELFPGLEEVGPDDVTKESVKSDVEEKVEQEDTEQTQEQSDLVSSIKSMGDTIEQASMEDKLEAIKILLG